MKTSLIAASALIAVLGFAAPAFAGDNADTNERVLSQLRSNGVDAVEVADAWNGKIRATVVVDGQQTFQYFDEDSLRPINGQASQSNTRVLSKLDTGTSAPVISLNSLTHESTSDNP